MSTPSEIDQWPALIALGDELDRLGRKRTSPRLLAWTGGGLGSAAAFLVLTAPGQAVTERVGEILGFDGQAAIVDRGNTIDQEHPYTVSVIGDAEPGETCVFLEFDEALDLGYGSCLAGTAPDDIEAAGFTPFIYPAPEDLLDDGSLVLQGLARADVVRVDVSYEGANGQARTSPADLTELSDATLEQLGLNDERFRFFVAFLPPAATRTLSLEEGVRPGDAPSGKAVAHLTGVTISAYGEDGALVGERRLDDLLDFEFRARALR